MMSKKVNACEFEKTRRNLKLIYSDDGGAWEVSLLYDEDTGHYITKGPFGRWDAVVYEDVGPLTKDQIEEWIKFYPKIKHHSKN